MRTIVLVISALMLFIVSGCGEQENSATEQPPTVGIHVAIIQGNLTAIQQHIRAGSDLNEREPSRGSTPLITAAVFGQTEIARALIEAGADVNLQNNEGSTALHSAAFFCRTEIVKILLENGADKSLKNNAGRIPYESVAAPFDDVRGIYDGLASALAPLGLRLDYEQIRMTRPTIAEMLR